MFANFETDRNGARVNLLIFEHLVCSNRCSPEDKTTRSPSFLVASRRDVSNGRLFLAENLIDVIELTEKLVGWGTIKLLHHCPVIAATIQRALCRRRTRCFEQRHPPVLSLSRMTASDPPPFFQRFPLTLQPLRNES